MSAAIAAASRGMPAGLSSKPILPGNVSQFFPLSRFRNPVVHYQPIVSPMDGKPALQEALARLPDDGRLIFPARFLDSARRFNAFPVLTQGVLERVCADLRDSPLALPVSINVPYGCIDTGFYELVFRTIAFYQIKPSQLIIEITEDEPFVSGSESGVILRALSGLGVRFMLDDFCERDDQYRSIRQLPFWAVKIDQDIMTSGRKGKLSQVLMRLRGFGVKIVVVEGIGSQLDSSTVIDAFIDFPELVPYCQGFYYSRPAERISRPS